MPAPVFIILSFKAIILFAYVLQMPFPMTCLSSTWENNIKLWKANSSQSADMYNQGWIRRGVRELQSSTPTLAFESKVHFHGKLWIYFGYRIYPKYSHPILSLYTYLLVHLRVRLCKIAGWVGNSVDPDETPHFPASDLCLHCLRGLVFPNT